MLIKNVQIRQFRIFTIRYAEIDLGTPIIDADFVKNIIGLGFS